MVKREEVSRTPSLKIMNTQVANYLVLTHMSYVFVMSVDEYCRIMYDILSRLNTIPSISQTLLS